MKPLDLQLAQDRTMRDAAKRLFKADLTAVREDLAMRGVGARAADRVGDAALDTLEDAVDYAQDHKGQVAAGISALLLFLFHGPLLDVLAMLLGHDDDEGDEAEPA